MAFPAMIRLKASFGALHAICPGQHGQLARSLGLIERFYPVEAAVFSSLYAEELAPPVIEIVSGMRGVIFFSFSEPVAERVRRSVPVDVFRVNPFPPPAARTPVYRHLLDGLSAIGLIEADAPDALAVASACEHCRLPEVSTDPAMILVHPGSGSRRKRWPLGRFFTLADSLEAAGLAPRFLIGPAEEDLAETIHEYRGGNYPVLRTENLVDLSVLLRSAAGLVGNDAGVAHLAAFLGIPTVSIFGPADPVRWAPVGPHVSIVRPPVDCEPCFETLPQNCDGERPRCLYDTDPVDVERALLALLKGR